jgi:molecular chaperone GrpE
VPCYTGYQPAGTAVNYSDIKDKNKHYQPMTTDNGKEMNNYENGGPESTMNINTDENISGTSHLNEPMAQEDQAEKFEAEIRDQKDKYLRLFADFENYKKRNARERMELIQTAGKEVIQSLLEVLDDCDRAEKQLNNATDVNAVKEGVQLVFNKLRVSLQSKGLKAMQSIGTDFNPDQHEAITEIPAPQEQMKGKVIDEVEKGYYLGDKIIRFAKVVVGK